MGPGLIIFARTPLPANSAVQVRTNGEKTVVMKERFKTMVPMGRIGKPEEIASTVIRLWMMWVFKWA